MKKVYRLALVIGTAALLSSTQVFALSTADVTLNGNDADAVWGEFDGNDTAGAVDSAVVGYGTGLFTYLDKTDSSDGFMLDGFSFDISVSSLSTSGTYTLSWTGGTVPAYFDFVFAAKASDAYALYLFDDVGLFSTPSSYGGTYTINFLNNGGQIPALSHLSVYGRTGDGTPPPEVPEPATMLLFGAGLAGLAGYRRRLKQ